MKCWEKKKTIIEIAQLSCWLYERRRWCSDLPDCGMVQSCLDLPYRVGKLQNNNLRNERHK